jgi:CHAT domain-containing protein
VRLRQNNYHIFHFIGHGAIDDETNRAPCCSKTAGAGSWSTAGWHLAGREKACVVVLNACQGGQTWANNPFGGVAQGLVQQSIPAVVAMQFPVTDQAAIAFSQGFYGALADFSPIDMAISEARKAMFFAGNAVEWGTGFIPEASTQIFNPAQSTALHPNEVSLPIKTHLNPINHPQA